MQDNNTCLLKLRLVQGMLRRAVDAFHRELDRYTLHDVLNMENKLKQLFAKENSPQDAIARSFK